MHCLVPPITGPARTVTVRSGHPAATSARAATSVSSADGLQRSFVPIHSATYRQCTSAAGGRHWAGSWSTFDWLCLARTYMRLMVAYDSGWVLATLAGLLMAWRGSSAGGEVWVGYQTAAPVVLAALLAAAADAQQRSAPRAESPAP
ncbi:hypothetical protein [Streptomyces sp. NPDC020571]|uniref:hypothetical protein n=1 Tax=Streptomyces sp. NPDC020571 TaxID=3365079 RepID=UPI003787F942